ncbi:hypothetical protein DL95DRAFT_407425 [Leptodontidium sp. 2 PMI_412]|nr:hypothetical protein DL95DRAFT_407425 [Leptodontidium sp. 2 PMI_412]
MAALTTVSPWNTAKVDQELVGSISSCLSESRITCVLWGHYLLNVYGVPSIVDSIDFVVPDEFMEASIRAISSRGLSRCLEFQSCPKGAENRNSPPPLAHFHLDSGIYIGLYPKSSTLGFLPNLELTSKSENMPPDIILASDPRLPAPRWGRGEGAFRAASPPVCIPSVHSFVEAYTRLLATTNHNIHGCFAMAMLLYIEEYVDEDALLDASLLEPRTRAYYLGRKNGTKPLAELFEDLKSAFSQEAI